MTSAEPVPQPEEGGAASSSDTPLFQEMAEAWALLGRAVPGGPDPAWDRLIAGRGDRPHAPVPSPRQELT
ncbi:hypothetical protein [Streptacidiphilus melanogenes]|uniref:hypothetical protein n=1 Tax=Streptacidiphilus melanogenes TaxID=411235 RepID=UPI0005A8E259|nr:hypothetical protein [Streptacidiphilus melanogenes]